MLWHCICTLEGRVFSFETRQYNAANAVPGGGWAKFSACYGMWESFYTLIIPVLERDASLVHTD